LFCLLLTFLSTIEILSRIVVMRNAGDRWPPAAGTARPIREQTDEATGRDRWSVELDRSSSVTEPAGVSSRQHRSLIPHAVLIISRY